MRLKKIAGFWWILDHPPALGPYATKAEAQDVRTGLQRFYNCSKLTRFQFFSFQGDEMMKVEKQAAVDLLVEVGIEQAGKWPTARLQKRVNKLVELNDEDEPLEAESAAGKKLLSEMLAALENGEEIEITDSGAGAEEDGDGEEKKPAKKQKKAGGGKKGTGPKKAGGEGKPGIIASIEEFVKAASEKKPITKEQVLEKLVARFPDRDKEAMSKTVNIQLPSRLNKEKGLGIVRAEDGGYYVQG